MGSNDSKANERPAHEVTLKPFLMGKTVLAQSHWDAGLNAQDGPQLAPLARTWSKMLTRFQRAEKSPLLTQSLDQRFYDAPGLPIHGISCLDIQKWLALTNVQLRLPSESEWEYACRAGTRTRFFWGDEMDARYCWHEANSEAHLHPIHCAQGSNAFGLHNVSGNILECVSDEYLTDYLETPRNGQSAGSGGSFWAVARGGCWSDPEASCRSGDRRQVSRKVRTYFLGVRLAASLADEVLRER
jgi:formylglycine-generating enzyme required for sulfatase activity